jgi:hypothetical protein
MIGGAPQAERDARRRQEVREQRRYEIARDCFAAERAAFNVASDMDYNDKAGARNAVEAADALLAALEGKR